MQILRTKCGFQWVTPFGASRTLPINCANNTGDSWPWKYWWTKTVGTSTPVSTSAITQSNASFDEQGNALSGQTVLRCFFAYVATDPIEASVNLSVSASPPWEYDSGEYTLNENISLVARLYDATTALIETYIDTDYRDAESSFTLPATVCPKVLWLNASIQPTGTPPDPPYAPSTTASITFLS
jgi:hypothetical protein